VCSGELESGGTRAEQTWGHRAPEKFFVASLHFLALKAQLVVLVSAFVMVITVWSVYCLLFFYSRCPVPSRLLKWGHVPPCPMESEPLVVCDCFTPFYFTIMPNYFCALSATIDSGEDEIRSVSVPASTGDYSSLSMSSLNQNVEYDTIQQTAPASD